MLLAIHGLNGKAEHLFVPVVEAHPVDLLISGELIVTILRWEVHISISLRVVLILHRIMPRQIKARKPSASLQGRKTPIDQVWKLVSGNHTCRDHTVVTGGPIVWHLNP